MDNGLPGQIRRLARALWGHPLQVAWQAGGPREQARAVLVCEASGDAVLHLPAGVRAGADLALAMAAHAAAHRHFGGPPQPRTGLKPVQQALLGVLEDARVEALAMQELPGLRAVWRGFHALDAAAHGAGFEALLGRLAASLLDPAHPDPHAWVARVRRMFFGADGCSLALRTPAQVREAASLLGHDIGQMRLPFNPRTYAVHAAYRDDNTCLWLPDETLPPSEVSLQAQAQPDDASGSAPPPQAAPVEPDARYPEWDHRIARYRPQWCSVYGAPAPAGPLLSESGAAAPGRRRLQHRLARLGGALRHAGGRSSEGGDLHPVALVEARLDLLAGRTPDPRIYRQPHRPPAPLAVLLLVDASASTADVPGLLGTLQRGAADAALALRALGHRSGVWAFSSQGRHRVDMPCLLPWDAPAAAMPRLQGAGSTRMGAALRHALQLSVSDARQHPGWRRMVVLLTDGEPHDVDVHDAAYLPADLRRAAHEAQALGIAVRGLVFAPGVVRDLAAALGPARVAQVRAPAALPGALVRLLGQHQRPSG